MNLNLRTLNPVLDRELRQRSRSMRSVVVLTAFLAMLIGVLYLAYEGDSAASQASGNALGALSGSTGRAMFEWLLTTELVILLVIIPAISAGAVAGERDRQTLIPLQVTLIGPVRIFLGKVLASSSFVLLLVIASAPVLAVPYLAGGISLSQVLLSLAVLLVIGLLLATMGVACSAVFRRTQTATLAAYFLMFALTLGSLVGLVTLAIFSPDTVTRGKEARLLPLYPNPFLALADAGGRTDGRTSVGPLSPIKGAINTRTDDQVAIANGVAVAPAVVAPVPVATTVLAKGGVVLQGPNGNAVVATTVPPGAVVVTATDGSPTGVVLNPDTQPPGLPDPGLNRVVQPAARHRNWVPVWVRTLVTEAVIALLLAALAVRRLRAPQVELHT